MQALSACERRQAWVVQKGDVDQRLVAECLSVGERLAGLVVPAGVAGVEPGWLAQRVVRRLGLEYVVGSLIGLRGKSK